MTVLRHIGVQHPGCIGQGTQFFNSEASLGTEGKRKGNGRERYSERPPRPGSRFGAFEAAQLGLSISSENDYSWHAVQLGYVVPPIRVNPFTIDSNPAK